MKDMEMLKGEIKKMRSFVQEHKDDFIHMKQFAGKFRCLLEEHDTVLSDIFAISGIVGLDSYNKVATTVDGYKDISVWIEEDNIVFSRYNAKTHMVDRIVVRNSGDDCYDVVYEIREDSDDPDRFIGISGKLFIVYEYMLTLRSIGKFSISYLNKWDIMSTEEKRYVQSLAKSFVEDIEASVCELLIKFEIKMEDRFEKL